MEIINEWLESIWIDIAEEGIGALAGIGLVWGVFLGGALVSFSELINLLASTI